MRTRIILGLLAILLLTGGAILLVHRLTEGDEAPARAPERLVAPVERPAEAPLPPAPAAFTDADPGAPIVIPAKPVTGGAVPNESPPIQGPAPIPLPEDPVERHDALDQVRRQRVAEQMERLNRRNQERAATAVPAPPPPPPKP